MAQERIPKILIFDSGFGGITILREIRKQNPHCQLLYCSDNGGFPYGTKSEDSLISRVDAVLQDLHQQESPDIIVVACNTASTVALPVIRHNIDIPIVGVVPAIKPAAQIAQGSHIGLLATPGTIQRPYTNNLIKQFGEGFQWVKVGSSELVVLAENMMLGADISSHDIDNIVAPFAQISANHSGTAQLDTIVLACTHFPLLKTELQQALPHVNRWIDSTTAIAERVTFWLNELGFVASNPYASTYEQHHQHKLIFTQEVHHQDKLMQFLVLEGFQDFEYLTD